jgi:hypothetical protein
VGCGRRGASGRLCFSLSPARGRGRGGNTAVKSVRVLLGLEVMDDWMGFDREIRCGLREFARGGGEGKSYRADRDSDRRRAAADGAHAAEKSALATPHSFFPRLARAYFLPRPQNTLAPLPRPLFTRLEALEYTPAKLFFF